MLILLQSILREGRRGSTTWIIRLAIYARATLSIIRSALKIYSSCRVAGLFGSQLLILKLFTQIFRDILQLGFGNFTSLGLLHSLFIVCFGFLVVTTNPGFPRRVDEGNSLELSFLIAVYGLLPETIRFSRAVFFCWDISFSLHCQL